MLRKLSPHLCRETDTLWDCFQQPLRADSLGAWPCFWRWREDGIWDSGFVSLFLCAHKIVYSTLFCSFSKTSVNPVPSPRMMVMQRALSPPLQRPRAWLLRPEKTGLQKTKPGFPGGSVVKNLPANQGDTGSIPGPGRSHVP